MKGGASWAPYFLHYMRMTFALSVFEGCLVTEAAGGVITALSDSELQLVTHLLYTCTMYAVC